MIVIGVDPGLTGGIAFLYPAPATEPMPVRLHSPTGCVRNAVDLPRLAGILRDTLPQHMFLERVASMGGQGVASMFSLGMSFWGVAGVAAGLGIPVTLVAPQVWKAYFKLGRDKNESLALARKLYPDVDLKRKKDNGVAEALLIARYGLETMQ